MLEASQLLFFKFVSLPFKMIIMEISCIGKNVFSYKLVVVMNLSKISLWTITKLPCESDTKYVVTSIQHSIFTSIQSYKQLYMYHISTKQTYKKHRRTLWLDCQHGSFSAGKGIGKWDNLLLWNLAKLNPAYTWSLGKLNAWIRTFSKLFEQCVEPNTC